jgi:hypothetical protein
VISQTMGSILGKIFFTMLRLAIMCFLRMLKVFLHDETNLWVTSVTFTHAISFNSSSSPKREILVSLSPPFVIRNHDIRH